MVLAAIVTAFAALFAFGVQVPDRFWWWMAANGVLWSAAALAADADLRRAIGRDLRNAPLRKALEGLASAAALYAVFAAGNAVLRGMGPSAGGRIDEVYALKEGVPEGRITALLTLVIGPAEEVIWRGFAQRRLAAWGGPRAGWAAATALYAGVHAGSGNPVLVLAALVGGAFWGGLYLQRGSLWTNAVSHTLWDLAVFVWFPFQTGA